MSLFRDQEQDQLYPARPPKDGAGRVQPAARGRGTGLVATAYVRIAGPALRGPAGILIAVASFAVAGAVGGRVGLAVASWYMSVIGAYGPPGPALGRSHAQDR